LTVSGNASTIFIGAVAPLAVSVLSVPAYLALIGAERYGVLLLVWIALDYFAVFGLGLDASVTNLLARNRHDRDARKRIFWTAFLLNASFGLFAGLIALFFASSLVGKLVDISSTHRPEILASLPYIALAIPVITVSAVLVGSLQAFERFFELTLLQFLGTLLLQLAPLAVAFWHGADLTSLVATAVVSRFVVASLLMIVTAQILELDGRLQVDVRRIKFLTQFGGWVALTSLIIPILANIDRFFIGLLAGSASVVYYTVPYNVVTKVLALPNSLVKALFPRLSIYDDKQAFNVSVEAIMTLATMLAPFLVAAQFFCSPLLSLWLGNEFAIHARSIPEILILGLWFNCLAYVPFIFLQARGRPDFVTKLQLLELLPFCAIMWFAIALSGVKGAAIAWSGRAIVDSLLLGYFTGHLKAVFPRLLLPAVLILAATVATLYTSSYTVWHLVIFTLLTVSTSTWAIVNTPRPLRDFLIRFARVRYR
jgi:O-antigen/teichoic acid export membrane protein